MLVNSKQLTSSHIKANDGELGKVKDVYFDDQHWTVRFLVVDTNRWLPLSQKVLLSPISVLKFDLENAELKVSMSKEMIEDCPKVEEEETVSREFEMKYFDYFGYGYYWAGADPWGDYNHPSALSNRDMQVNIDDNLNDVEKTNHLRSSHEVQDYDVTATNGDKGHVHDFIWDTDDWSLKYVVIDTHNWLPGGKKVVVAIEHIDSISYEKSAVFCSLSIAQIKACPEYDADKLNRTGYIEF